MKVFFIDSYKSYELEGKRTIELYMYHGYKLPAKGQDFINTNFYGEPKKSPGALIKNIFMIDKVIYPDDFVVNLEVLKSISSLNFEFLEIDFLCPYYADNDQQKFIKANFKNKLFEERDFLEVVRKYEVLDFSEKYYQIYFPNITALEDNYSKVKSVNMEFGPLNHEYNATIKYDSQMFLDYEVLLHPKGTFFSEKAFNIFWPLLNEKYFYYRIYDI